MKLLITGANGQVGRELARQAAELDWQIAATGQQHLDITNAAKVRTAIVAFQPDAIINAAAYTAVDRAESEPGLAFAVNRDGPANLAAVCAEVGIPLVHYSSDYVFDGSKRAAYVETDAVAPLGVYGQAKLAGEQAVRAACPQHLILRTSWVFSAHGHNFVKTMLRLGLEREALSVVADQFGKPTSASELARLTLQILPNATGYWGTYHLAQPDVTSWHGFAADIFTEGRRQRIDFRVVEVRPITIADYPMPAKRPANSELNCDKLEAAFGVKIRPWKDSLAEVIRKMSNVGREMMEA